MTEILMMTLTPQLRKIAIKKRASHPSSIREPDLDFRKLVDKLEQAEITMKLEETENLKLQYFNRIETNTTHINNVQESDTDLIEKITEILNIYERNPNFKGKPSFKKWCNFCRRYGHSISECRQKQQDNQSKPQKHKEPNKSFYQYMKKDQNLPNKNIYSNNSSGKLLPGNSNYTRNQSTYNSSYRGRSPERGNTRNFSQNRYNRSNSQNNQNNYSRSNSNTIEFVSESSSQSNPRKRNYSNNQSRSSSCKRNRNYSHNRNRSYSNNRNQNYPNNRSRNNSYNRSNYHRSNDNYQKRSRNNSQNRNSSYNNRYRNYSQSPHRNIKRYHLLINAIKQQSFFSKFYPIYNQKRKHLKPLSGNIYNFSIKQVHQYDKSQNKQQLFMSDFEFKPIHKFFKITISSIKYSKNTNSDTISLHVHNNTSYQVTLPLGLLGYCETNATISPINEVAYRVINILQLLDICQSTILDEELSINKIISNEKRNTDYFTKTPYFKPTFNITIYTKEQQKFLTMFNFEHSQIEFDKLAKQLLKYSTVYATSKFDVGKISSSLHLPLKPDAVFKKQRVKYRFTYMTR